MSRRFLAGSALALLAACGGKSGGGPTGPGPQTVASVVVTPGRDTLFAVGLTKQFSASARDASGNVVTGKTFTWQSSAPAIVSVDPGTGVATAVAQGEANVTASVDGKTGNAAVVVTQQVSTVDVTPGTPTITSIGGTQQFAAVAKDANGATVSNVAFLWLSSDQTIATIDNTGKATAKAPGTVTITAAGFGVPGSTTLTVTQVATQLAITVAPPANVTEGVPFPTAVQVEIRDGAGTLVAGARNTVSLAIGNNNVGGILSGTVTANAVGGIATFPGLTISDASVGYTLVATAGGLTPAATGFFTVLLNFASTGGGGTTTCGLTRSHAVYCWGTNTNGSVGDGTTTTRTLPTRVVAPAGVRFATVAQNARDASALVTNCALAETGAAYCWGYGPSGAIGDGGTTNRLTATQVLAPAGVTFISLTAGHTYTCGLAPTGTAYCWGNGILGTLGDGLGTNHSLPAAVTPPGGVFFASISAGFGTACGTTSIGTAYCWGQGGLGQIGDGTTTAQRNSPTAVTMPGGIGFTTVQPGSTTCGLTFTGQVYCWGDNTQGSVGDGTNTPRLTPVPVVLPGGVTSFTFLVNGLSSACAVANTGAAYCWGLNQVGQLGDGTLTPRNVPTPVSMPPGVTFVSMATASGRTCGVTATGAMWCWGIGPLGDGITGQRSTPIQVAR